MFYKFRDNIYLVKGHVNSCIYDIPHNQLHICNKSVTNLLERIISNEEINDSNEIAFSEKLIELEILDKNNESKHTYKSIESVYSYPREIEFAWIELTNICNLRCIHCYNEHDNIPKNTLTLEELRFVVDELCSIGVEKVQLIGGEPFVIQKEVLFEMIDYVASHMKSFEIFINGTLTEENDLIVLQENYHNMSIATSLHSYIESEHEKVTRVTGSYKKTVNTLHSLSRLGIQHRFVGALIGECSIGTDCGVGNPSRRDFIRLSGRANLRLYNDDLLRKKIITEKKIHSGNIEETLKYNYDKSCFATHLYIGSDMNVYPCPMERRIYHGNLRTEHLRNMIKLNIINFSKDNVEECCDCEYRYLCLDCRPDTLYGSLKEKPWYCTYRPNYGTWESFEEFKERLYTTNK